MRAFTVFGVLAAMTAPAAAQMSVTTIGATEAASCFANASNEFSSDTSACDEALDDPSMTRVDRKKTLVNRGIIHNRNGDLTAALDDFENALQIDGGLGEAYLNRGNSYFLAARYDDALSDYERALRANVTRPWAAWYNIGLVHDAQNRVEEANAAYEKALEENPDFTLARQKLENRT